jgi:hypothetical protein
MISPHLPVNTAHERQPTAHGLQRTTPRHDHLERTAIAKMYCMHLHNLTMKLSVRSSSSSLSSADSSLKLENSSTPANPSSTGSKFSMSAAPPRIMTARSTAAEMSPYVSTCT